jgi:PAS domain S-box-containing protein
MKNRPPNTINGKPFSVPYEEALNILLNNLDEVFLLVNKQLKIVQTTESTKENVRRNYGIDISNETSILELVAPERRPLMIELYKDVFNGIERDTVVEVARDGKPAIFETHFTPARNASGEVIGAVVVAKDVTEKKKSENTLKETEERWRFALEGGNQGVWDWNVQTGEIFFSDSYKRLYGYDQDDLKGRIEEWEDMIHPDDKKKMEFAIDQHLSNPNPYYESTYRVKTKNGNYKWVLGRGMLLRDKEGKPSRMIGTHTDITKQVAAEQTYKLLFFSNPLPMFTYDLETLRFLTVNDAAINHYGYSKEEFLSMTIKDIRPEEEKPEFLRWMERRKELGHLKRTSRHLKKDGDIITVELSTHRLDDSNAVLVVAQDITARTHAEQILSLERTVFELSNQPGIDFKNLVETLLKGFEQIYKEAFASLILLKDNDTIESFVAPRLPNEYLQKLNGLKIGPEEGSCGTAMWQKQTIIVEDISSHPFWEKYKSLALHFGLHSCWSLPIIHTSGKVMGSFAVYYKKIKAPSSVELNTLERIRNIIRILMEHHWSLNEIKKANERFDIMMKATHDLIWDWDLQANMIYRSALGLEKVYGIKDNKSIEKIEQWLSHVHPDDVEKVRKTIDGVLMAREENTFDVEYRFKKDDGTYSFVYDRGMIIRNEEGKPIRLIGAAQDITERKNLEEELLHNELEKQKAINQATVDSQELERSEIGKELHDNVNQILTTTKLYLDLALSNQELKDELIAKSTRNIMGVINEIRQLSRSLMDPTIGDLGLMDSINDLIENINLTRKLYVTMERKEELECLLSKNHKLTIFRIIQEALNNAVKHAKAATVEISFKLFGNSVMVIIKDDGVGFDPAAVKMGAGLKNIQNRVYLINGTYTIQTSPQNGCKIIINFPINK